MTTQCREGEASWLGCCRGSLGRYIAHVSAFFYTRTPPSRRGAGGGIFGPGCKKRIDHSDNVDYVKFHFLHATYK